VVGPVEAGALSRLLGPAAAATVAALEATPGTGNMSRRYVGSGAPPAAAAAPQSTASTASRSGCCTRESGAQESQSQMAHALCFWQATIKTLNSKLFTPKTLDLKF